MRIIILLPEDESRGKKGMVQMSYGSVLSMYDKFIYTCRNADVCLCVAIVFSRDGSSVNDPFFSIFSFKGGGDCPCILQLRCLVRGLY